MSPSQPARPLKIKVPRHNAQRLGPAVTAEVYSVAREMGVNVQLPPPVQEQPSSAGPSSENASEWNSLLTTARADRGPQWDVGTQQFLVEKESTLYYDPTPLLDAARRAKASESEHDDGAPSAHGSAHPALAAMQQEFMMSPAPGGQQQYRGGGNPYPQQAYPGPPGHAGYGSPMMAHAGTPVRGAFAGHTGGTPGYGAGGFYARDGREGTPGRPGMMDGSPEVRRSGRVTRGMAEDYGAMF